jgi:hypothetical protein
MAGDITSLVEEVRSLTEYDEAVFSSAELTELVELAQQEIQADVDDPNLEFFADGNHAAERALFWLTCIFAKVRAGEIEAPNVSISSLRIRQASATERHGLWFARFEKNLSKIVPSGAEATSFPMGIASIQRADERTYGYGDRSSSTGGDGLL